MPMLKSAQTWRLFPGLSLLESSRRREVLSFHPRRVAALRLAEADALLLRLIGGRPIVPLTLRYAQSAANTTRTPAAT